MIAYTSFITRHWMEPAASLMHGANRVTIRVGLDILATPQEVLIDLVDIAGRPRRNIVLLKHLDGGTFHPKFYAVRTKDRVVAVLGSSNASEYAFDKNLEANVILDGSRGGREDRLVSELSDRLESVIAERETARRLRVWRLPADRLPVVRPSRLRRSSFEEEVLDTFKSDGWIDNDSFLAAAEITSFNSPLSGLYGYADDTGRQAGIYIPKANRAATLSIVDSYGHQEIDLSWRFATSDGATVFSLDETRPTLRATGRQAASHNLAITASRSEVAVPATRRLRALGVSASDRVQVTYRLDTSNTPPRLWLVHQIMVQSPLIDPSIRLT